jgi:hypothetical protein
MYFTVVFCMAEAWSTEPKKVPQTLCWYCRSVSDNCNKGVTHFLAIKLVINKLSGAWPSLD